MRVWLDTRMNRDKNDVYDVVLDDCSDVIKLRCKDEGAALRLMKTIEECVPSTALFYCCLDTGNKSLLAGRSLGSQALSPGAVGRK